MLFVGNLFPQSLGISVQSIVGMEEFPHISSPALGKKSFCFTLPSGYIQLGGTGADTIDFHRQLSLFHLQVSVVFFIFRQRDLFSFGLTGFIDPAGHTVQLFVDSGTLGFCPIPVLFHRFVSFIGA